MSTETVLAEVAAERIRQNEKWGEQNHPDGTGREDDDTRARMARIRCNHRFKQGRGTYRDILIEEVWEALAETDPARLRAELVQVAAVAVQWIEKLDREAQKAVQP